MLDLLRFCTGDGSRQDVLLTAFAPAILLFDRQLKLIPEHINVAFVFGERLLRFS
jgi:hypothetical protein